MSNISIFDEDGKVVVVELNGKRTVITSCKKFNNFDIIEKFTRQYGIQHMHIKENIVKEYVKAGDTFGCSVAYVTRMLNGAINRVFTHPNYDSIRRLAYHKGIFRCQLADAIVLNKEIIQQYIDDGNSHLIGFAIVFGDSATGRKEYGKGLWKSLCKNSKTRKDTIARLLYPFHLQKGIVDVCRYLQATPSSLLKYRVMIQFCHLGHTFPRKVVKYLNKPMYKIKPDELGNVANIIVDCKRMLGDRFNTNWSIIRMVREHDKESARLAALQYTDDNFPYYDHMPHTIISEDGEYQAELVRSPSQLNVLSSTQHHCVGSYHERCWDSRYAVYTVTNKEGAIGTLGFGVGNSLFSVQHYYECNRPVTDLLRLSFGRHVYSTVSVAVNKSNAIQELINPSNIIIKPTQVFEVEDDVQQVGGPLF